MAAKISITHFSDPGCPFAYSAAPALAVLRWRYGSQLDWRLVTIGLSEDASRYEELGYTPTRMTLGNLKFRRHGMPFALEPRSRSTATSRACRAIVAARLAEPGREYDVHRALQFAWFTSTLLLDEDADIETALASVAGLDVAKVVASIDDEATLAGYEADKQETRQAAGSPTEFQGKARQSDGPVRYSAPSLIFEHDGTRLEAGGFQTIEAYDVLVANLDPTLAREAPAEDALEVLERFPEGVVSQEVAAVMAQNNQAPDRAGAEHALIELAGAGRARRTPLGDDALWQPV
ncbi:MAG TPA: DsbA family protein [Solirubrobacteraceae bacterium]|jgi:predicted DsbA family dithiol-disulfide isomerase|nr:DsbA family protein [Solirubrobacteraceae bacterium]